MVLTSTTAVCAVSVLLWIYSRILRFKFQLPHPILSPALATNKKLPLTAVFFETGAMSTPTKSQNVTNCGSGGLFQS